MDQKNQICRLCLSNTNNLPFQKVTSKYSLVYNLVNIYFGIQISESDQFSKLVCKPCIVKITDFHNYALSVKQNNGFKLESIKTEHDDTKSGITDIALTSNGIKKIDVKPDENDLKSIEQVYIKEYFAENEPSCSTLDDTEEDSSSDDAKVSVNTSGNLPVVEPKVILKESDDSSDSEPVKAKYSSKKREKARKLANYPETPNDIQIKKFYKYECDLCKDHSEITSFRAFKIHYKSKHGIAAYIKCCGRKFKRPYALVGHIEEHLMPDCLKCPNCSKKLRTKQTLLLHMDTHVPVEQRPLKCKYCEMRFVRKHFLIQHEKIHLSDDELKYICDLCGKRFPTDWRLRTHLNSTHSDEKPFVCDVCAKTFKLKVQLQNHMYIHNNKEGHKQCEHCGVWLKSPRTYYVHMKEKHDDSAPKSFPCTKCTHVSPTRKALYAHSINKHGPKKHNCIYCGDAFSSSNLLKSHMIKHTGPGEPLKCPFCPKTFSFRSGYYSHKKKVHPNMTEIK